MDRIVKDLQIQLERKDKQNEQLQEDVTRMRDKADKLLKTIDELQASESSVQLTARRAERELREERDKALRLERELEGWKSMSMSSTGSVSGGGGGGSIASFAGGSMRRAGTQNAFRSSALGHTASTATTRTSLSMVSSAPSGMSSAVSDAEMDVPQRKDSVGLTRAPSMTKGFL